MLRYKKEKTGKIYALEAMQNEGCLSSEVENKAAPYLKGQTLFEYLVGTNGIDGMLKRQLPKDTIQRVLARCMKEKDKKKDLDAAQGIWGFVEFLKSDVATNKEGIPDFIIEMGYEAHFPSKWANPTPNNLFHEKKPLMPFIPTLAGFEPIEEKIMLEHTTLPAQKLETPFDNYYNRLSNLVHSTEMGRYQEGLAFGCDILQCYPDGGEKALQVYLFLAECGGALYSHTLAKKCLEMASKVADSKNRFQCANIASSVQTIFRMWGCFEEESAVYHQEGLKDKFSSIHVKSFTQHIEAQFDCLINTLAERCCDMIFHKSCPEECHSPDGQRKTRHMIDDLKTMATADDCYSALLYTCEAADWVLQLRTNQNMNIERLTGAALFTAQLARKTQKNDPMLRSLIALLNLNSELTTKKCFLMKMSKISQSMSKTTRTRNSLLAANIFFTQAVLMSILGPTGRHVKTFFQHSLKTFQIATNHQHYRIHLIEHILAIVFGDVKHGIQPELLPTDPTHIIQALAAQDILCGEPHLGTSRQSVESIIRESPNLMGSLSFGLESIKNRI